MNVYSAVVLIVGLFVTRELGLAYLNALPSKTLPQSKTLPHDVPCAPRMVEQVTSNFAMVADLDLKSRHPERFEWQSELQLGVVQRMSNGNYTVTLGESRTLVSHTARNNRSMELSDLAWWRGGLYTVCDFTGVLFKISGQDAFQRYVLMDGDGLKRKPFKAEWMTTKGDQLLIGSIGMEWSSNGTILHRDAEWIKQLDPAGKLRSYSWSQRYAVLRRATNTTMPGYLQHEAIEWHAATNQWLVLPRRASTETPFSPIADLRQGTNMLILVNEDFTAVNRIVRVGPHEPEFGFTSLTSLPHGDAVIALKVRETQSGDHSTKLTIFGLDGQFRLHNADKDGFLHVSSTKKFEGIALTDNYFEE